MKILKMHLSWAKKTFEGQVNLDRTTWLCVVNSMRSKMNWVTTISVLVTSTATSPQGTGCPSRSLPSPRSFQDAHLASFTPSSWALRISWTMVWYKLRSSWPQSLGGTGDRAVFGGARHRHKALGRTTLKKGAVCTGVIYYIGTRTHPHLYVCIHL